ncbi:MAG: type II toxin-antitoxin system VapC family toxin [Gammaproteobacteria bacterium]|nr:type II toxin-antitoxin system VapC family toxin [Gammaproteobacteria bacterium]MBU1724863.1 type II toxin-antitoxin system VapC family toxin [Gammaproteobacteria bacterium]MBU2005047.1 type II toxin-antitoxin system VapC family toxin [Gammaproteobacteria bacterium]
MILLDTNVISELMKVNPEPNVLAWTDRQLDTDLYFSAISKGEVEWGIALLADGKRKRQLADIASEVFALFDRRCLDYSCDITPHYVAIAAFAKQVGRPMRVEDMLIAAVAQANDCVLATRNVTDFDFLSGLVLVNPWAEAFIFTDNIKN